MVYVYEFADYSLTFIRGLAGLLFFYAYLRSKRSSALFVALSWFFSIPVGTFGLFFDLRIESVFMGTSYSLLILGMITLIKEETEIISSIKSIYLIPLTVIIFSWTESFMEDLPEDSVIISGIFAFIMSMFFIESLRKFYGRDAIALGLSLAIGGIVTSFYPVVYEGYSSSPPEVLNIVLIFTSMFSILVLYFYYRIIFSEKFFKKVIEKTNFKPIEVKGVQIISPKEFENWKTTLNGYPLLAFLRSIASAEGWIIYKFSSVEGQNVIYPTDLYKIPEFVFRYFMEAKNKGVKGIVVLEGLEFLRVYNDFQSIAKMMASVRDYVFSHNGALIVVLSKEALDEREFNPLIRLLT